MAEKIAVNKAAIAERLSAWDAGKPVWSVDMGGMGPGYEQCIQNIVLETLRAIADRDEITLEEFKVERDKVAHALSESHGGFSGAQVGAAGNLAWNMACNDEDGIRAMVTPDRMIQVSKSLPKPLTADEAHRAGFNAARSAS